MDAKQVSNMIEPGRHLVPPHMWDGVVNYFVHRYPPGDFMRALCSNDLMNAMGRADDINQANMHRWCQFLYCYAPIGSYGTPAHVARWLQPEEQAA
jgi:hypothetical protein